MVQLYIWNPARVSIALPFLHPGAGGPPSPGPQRFRGDLGRWLHVAFAIFCPVAMIVGNMTYHTFRSRSGESCIPSYTRWL